MIADNEQRFDITPGGQQIHISSKPTKANEPDAPRHPCFKVESIDALARLQGKIWESFEKGEAGKPLQADKPGSEGSGR